LVLKIDPYLTLMKVSQVGDRYRYFGGEHLSNDEMGTRIDVIDAQEADG